VGVDRSKAAAIPWCCCVIQDESGYQALGVKTRGAAASQSVSDFTVPPRAHPSTGTGSQSGSATPGLTQVHVPSTRSRGLPAPAAAHGGRRGDKLSLTPPFRTVAKLYSSSASFTTVIGGLGPAWGGSRYATGTLFAAPTKFERAGRRPPQPPPHPDSLLAAGRAQTPSFLWPGRRQRVQKADSYVIGP
jgi:hypothetical protein